MIDTHEHLWNYPNADHLLAHQDVHGIRRTVVLPIDGVLAAARRDPFNDFPLAAAWAACQQYPDRLVPFVHVDPRRPDALDTIRRYHALGAKGFGEHKLHMPCDAPEALAVYRLCGELGLPVLLHLEYGNYSYNVEAFGDVVRAHPQTAFIGHAQAWWANVSADPPRAPNVPGFSAYPTGPVTPGGLTDRWLTEYPNLYADLSAGSALNALTRDPEFARGFVNRHRAKLMWATDCPCLDGRGSSPNGRQRPCFAAQSLAALKELCADQATYDDIVEHNAARLLKLD
jgi:predicted TIM-barrel fold metal-dependent hydrolase